MLQLRQYVLQPPPYHWAQPGSVAGVTAGSLAAYVDNVLWLQECQLKQLNCTLVHTPIPA